VEQVHKEKGGGEDAPWRAGVGAGKRAKLRCVYTVALRKLEDSQGAPASVQRSFRPHSDGEETRV
jgi:hypothetical protein